MGENMQGQMTVALRIARVNHACQPNAAAIHDETASVAILFAQKDIQPGEEISICYYSPLFMLVQPPLNIRDMDMNRHFQCFKSKSLSSFGIFCRAHCPCHDPAIGALIQEGKQINAMVRDLACQGKVLEALSVGEKLRDIQRRLNVSWVQRAYTEVLLFHTAVMKSETLPRAKEYIQLAAEIFQKICPYSERQTKLFVKWGGAAGDG